MPQHCNYHLIFENFKRSEIPSKIPYMWKTYVIHHTLNAKILKSIWYTMGKWLSKLDTSKFFLGCIYLEHFLYIQFFSVVPNSVTQVSLAAFNWSFFCRSPKHLCYFGGASFFSAILENNHLSFSFSGIIGNIYSLLWLDF